MNLSFKKKALNFYFVIFAVLVSTNLWSFQSIDEGIYEKLELLIIGIFILIIISNSHILIKKELIFKWQVHLFIWIPFLSVFGAYLYHDQPYYLSLILLRGNFFWLLYFVLHILKISKQQVINLLLFVGAVWAFLTIIQQFTYPTYYFYSRGEENQSIFRAGVYRYMLSGRQYGLFFLLYFFYKFLTTSKIKNLFFVFCGLSGFYYYGTRQFAVVAVACMVIAVLSLQGRAKWKYILFAIACILLILPFSKELFGSYIEMTSDQLEFENENIRMIAANFYLYEYWPHWGAKILGNGLPHHASDYGQEMIYITQVLRLFRSDVGIIGVFNQYGIFYVLNILAFNLKGIFMKFANINDKYLKLLFYGSIFTLLLSQSYTSLEAMPFFCMLIYLIDLSYQEHKEKNRLSASDNDPNFNSITSNSLAR